MQCPLCNSRKTRNETVLLNDTKKEECLHVCKDCGLSYLHTLKGHRKDLYDEKYSVWSKENESHEKIISESKKANFRLLLKKLHKHVDFTGKSILDIGTGKGYLLEVAKESGFKEMWGVELSPYSAAIARKKFPGHILNSGVALAKLRKKFDVIVMADVLEHLQTPRAEFAAIDSWLKKGGILVITTPNTDSITRRVQGGKWMQYKHEHVVYFSKQSIMRLLKNYQVLAYQNNAKRLKLGYYRLYLKKYPSFLKLPEFLDNIAVTNPWLGEMLVIARKRK